MYKKLFNNIDERVKDYTHLWNEQAKHDQIHMNEEKELIKYLNESGFFMAPASTKYHGNWEGGLYEHSRAVFIRLQTLTDELGLVWGRPESPFIIGMFHDLCKCDQYLASGGYPTVTGPDGIEIQVGTGTTDWSFNENTLLKGHGAKSVMILSTLLRLTEEEMLCIRYHMGAYEKEEWSEFDRAIRKYPNVLWTHTADMLASKVDGI